MESIVVVGFQYLFYSHAECQPTIYSKQRMEVYELLVQCKQTFCWFSKIILCLLTMSPCDFPVTIVLSRILVRAESIHECEGRYRSRPLAPVSL